MVLTPNKNSLHQKSWCVPSFLQKRREGETAGHGLWPHLPEPSGGSRGAALGYRGPCRDTSQSLFPSVWEGSGDGQGKEKEETVRRQSSRQTHGQAPEEMGIQPQQTAYGVWGWGLPCMQLEQGISSPAPGVGTCVSASQTCHCN